MCRRILLFPFGNNVDQCSIYLEHGFEPNEVPEDWSCCVQFALVLWNPEEPTIFAHHSAHHRFTKEESDWGFTKFLESRRMYGIWDNANRPMIENDAANITVYVRIVEDETGVLWHNFNNYDSKKETGFVGLKNQGATCYLNSLLQSLYFTNAFRKVFDAHPWFRDWQKLTFWEGCVRNTDRTRREHDQQRIHPAAPLLPAPDLQRSSRYE